MDFDHGNGSSKQTQTHIELDIGSSRHSRDGSERSRHSSEESESSKYSRRAIFDDEIKSGKHSNEGSGSYEHSRRHIEFDCEIRSSRHSSEARGSGSDSDIYPDIINKRGGNESDHFEITTDIFKVWGNDNDFQTHQELIDGGYSSRRSEVIRAENDRNEGHIVFLSTEKMRLSSSPPSSSSRSPTDDQFEADIELSESRSGVTSTSSSKFHEDTVQSLNDEHCVSGNNSSKSEECQNGTAGVTGKSQVSNVIRESTSTQSPPIQVMDRLGDCDPSRIPSAVFARNQSTNPADWSTASNDSLFSIQVGNNSFSRDQILSLKSGELFKSGEFIAFSPSSVSPVVYTGKKDVKLDKSEAALVPDEAVKKNAGPIVEEPVHEKPKHVAKISWNASPKSKHSDDSATSGGSFAFQTRKKKENKKNKKQKKCSACPSCYCSKCSWAFCYRKWPSCCFSWSSCRFRWPSCRFRWPSCRFKWPSCRFRWPSCCFKWPSCSCSNCSWAFCCCWNCSMIRWCCHSSNLTDRGNDGTKGKPEQQRQVQPKASSLPSKSSWCSCCSWFPSCGCQWQWCCCCSCKSCS